MIPKKQIVDLPVYQPGKPIDEVKRELGLEQIVKLASNENPFGCSPKVKEAIVPVLDQLAIYPDGGSMALREELAAFLEVDGSQLVFGNGSDELVMLTSRAYLEPGANTVMATPTFPVYKTTATVEGAEVIEVPLVDGVHDLKGLLANINEQTRVVWVCNPNNPSGTMNSEEEIKTFLDQVPKSVLVVLDEAYYEYVTDASYPESLKLLPQYSNVLILRTFSKIYGLAGLRIGYGVASPDIVDKLNRVREPFNTSSIAQVAAIAAMKDQEFVQSCRSLNDSGRKQLYAAFDEMGLSYYPSQGNFVLVDTKKDGNDVFQALLQKGYIIRSGRALGFPTWIRVTVGNEEQNSGFLAALREVL
ncbi:histidinol-phosphate transaminase [Ammoniphilus sp. CFH 90114]|uniref:histidinol-phosphate transaminase n=1 Tax=Ammoniphilus sp. CFH 90114 TaxID=2493665 RepID=UPI00100E2884|nr:histidinol-phosphate transaminase [Ammoniphilus sp. CFH 90114]RXT13918.1 histidinol-phosphate transaminase [Ammoniphilus sp. CFH 90114]